jgi:hypothetical protein
MFLCTDDDDGAAGGVAADEALRRPGEGKRGAYCETPLAKHLSQNENLDENKGHISAGRRALQRGLSLARLEVVIGA